MPASNYREYAREKAESEWKRRVDAKKKDLSNAKRIELGTDYKKKGSDKFSSGNVVEAIDYYREAYAYVYDLVDACRKDRVRLSVPLSLNLARCYEKLGDKCVVDAVIEQNKYEDVLKGGRDGSTVLNTRGSSNTSGLT